MKIQISEKYLWLPVDKEKPEVRLHFYICTDSHMENSDRKKIQELDLHLGGTDGDFYAYMDVSDYLGMEMEVTAEAAEELLCGIFCCGEKVQNIYPFRPKLHFSPEIGWHNDPNGLVYANGTYHLYYQWNPYGTAWGNMHWGHAVSKDLLHWEKKQGAVLLPNAYGTAYSGCAWEDKENVAGCGKNALLFYYTAAGGKNDWSTEAGNPLFTQRLAVSLDGGETLRLSDAFLMGHVVGENRDPKVFYHKQSAAYIMVLYLDGYEFAIYRSHELLHWEETQRFSMKGMWECPDLFELSVTGAENEKKWVFWSADGYYVVGEFDGYRFTAQSEVLNAYGTKLPYAAQTYAGMEDRTVSVAWLRMENDRGNYRGLMSLPVELSLARQQERFCIRMQPVRELKALRRPFEKLKSGQRQAAIKLNGEPLEVLMRWRKGQAGQTKLLLGNTTILVDFAKESIRISGQDWHSDIENIPFSRDIPLSMQLIIDQEVIEFFGNDGLIYGAVETEENVLGKELRMESTADMDAMMWCVLK